MDPRHHATSKNDSSFIHVKEIHFQVAEWFCRTRHRNK